MNAPDLRHEIQDALNRHGAENGSNTPDFILAEYLLDCLKAFDKAQEARQRWYAPQSAPLSSVEPLGVVS